MIRLELNGATVLYTGREGGVMRVIGSKWFEKSIGSPQKEMAGALEGWNGLLGRQLISNERELRDYLRNRLKQAESVALDCR